MTAVYLCFASLEKAHIDPKASIATTTPRLMRFDFHVESFSMGLLDVKLMGLDLFKVASFNMVLSDERLLIWEALCTGTVLSDDTPGFVM